jgi:hypothetical protein
MNLLPDEPAAAEVPRLLGQADAAGCVYEETDGDPAIVVCVTHDPDYGLYGDEWCPHDEDSGIRSSGSI